MKIIAIIQSRMSSKRYPGKMLAPFLGKPMIHHVVDQIKSSKLKPKIILATSNEVSDDPLAFYAKKLDIKVVRGSLDDVVSRFTLVLNKIKCDAFFRVCGDSPLLLPYLFDSAAMIFKKYNYDLITNVYPKTFPAGMTIELIKTKIFIESEKKILQKYEREHLTQYFYRNSKDFKIFNIKCLKSNSSNLKLSLDRLQDLKRLEIWCKNKNKNYYSLFPVKKHINKNC